MAERDVLGEVEVSRTPSLPIYSAEDPLEAIYGSAGALSHWEQERLLADEARINREYRSENPRRKKRIIGARALKQLLAGQQRLPDIYQRPIPEKTIQLRLFSELEFKNLRRIVEAHRKPQVETGRVTPTGIPMHPSDSMVDIIHGTEWRKDR